MRFCFAEATAPGQIYRASPMSLLYAIAPLYKALAEGRIRDSGGADLLVGQPRSLDEFLGSLAHWPSDLVGFSVTTYGAAFTRASAAAAKKLVPEVQIVAGGPHFDGLYGHYGGCAQLLASHVPTSVDVIVSGDAERPLERLAALAADRPGAALTEVIERHREELQGLGGWFALWWRSRRGLEILTSCEPKRPRGEAVCRARLPREVLPLDCEKQFSIFRDARGELLRTAQVLTYRGCMFAANPRNACSFCFAANRFERFQMAEAVTDLEELSEAGYRAVFFDDAVFTSRSPARKADLRLLADALRELSFEAIGFQTRADFLDEEVLAILTSVDTRWYCSLGLESTDPVLLAHMDKRQSIAAVQSALELLAGFRIDVGLYLLFGAVGPAADDCRTGETRCTAEATIDFVARQAERVPVVCTLPGVSMILPGTKDALRYEASAIGSRVPLRFDICHEGDPWQRFEGGLGMHAPGVTPELLHHIDAYGQSRLGHLWGAS